jgi:hypothetical protein
VLSGGETSALKYLVVTSRDVHRSR